MPHKLIKQKAIELRKKGKSYSQIKTELGVSKSTLSGWLSEMPLSKKEIHALQAVNPIRIERYRNTMMKKKQERLALVYKNISAKIGQLSDREFFIAGLFLYWAEGTKSRQGSVELTNTNPGMLQFFLKWLELVGVSRDSVRIKLHLYEDMDVVKQHAFWVKTLQVKKSQFNKPYIKKTTHAAITYRTGFGHGTCAISVSNTKLSYDVLMGVRFLQDMCHL